MKTSIRVLALVLAASASQEVAQAQFWRNPIQWFEDFADRPAQMMAGTVRDVAKGAGYVGVPWSREAESAAAEAYGAIRQANQAGFGPDSFQPLPFPSGPSQNVPPLGPQPMAPGAQPVRIVNTCPGTVAYIENGVPIQIGPGQVRQVMSLSPLINIQFNNARGLWRNANAPVGRDVVFFIAPETGACEARW